jgi:hypothetical protein
MANRTIQACMETWNYCIDCQCSKTETLTQPKKSALGLAEKVPTLKPYSHWDCDKLPGRRIASKECERHRQLDCCGGPLLAGLIDLFHPVRLNCSLFRPSVNKTAEYKAHTVDQLQMSTLFGCDSRFSRFRLSFLSLAFIFRFGIEWHFRQFRWVPHLEPSNPRNGPLLRESTKRNNPFESHSTVLVVNVITMKLWRDNDYNLFPMRSSTLWPNLRH